MTSPFDAPSTTSPPAPRPATTRIVFLLVFVFLATPDFASSTSAARLVDPLQGARTVSIEVRIYRAPLIDDDRELQLFSGSPDRREAFLEHAHGLIAKRLSDAGLTTTIIGPFASPSPQSPEQGYPGRPDYYLHFGVRGYRILLDLEGYDRDPVYSFSVQLSVHRECGEDLTYDDYDDRYPYEFEEYGSSVDSELESQLSRVISHVLDHVLSLRRDPAQPSVFVSSNRRFEVHVTPPRFDCRLGKNAFDYGERTTPFLASLCSVNAAGERSPVSSFPLIGSSPRMLLVSDSGERIVSINEWWGPWDSNTVVIYRADGSIVRSLAIADVVTERDSGGLRGVSMSFTEAWAEHYHLDPELNQLVLELPPCTVRDPGDRECELPWPEVRIDLATGELAQPMTDLLPYLQGSISMAPDQSDFDVDLGTPFPPSECSALPSSALASAVPVSIDEYRRHAETLELPTYPTLAEKARVHGEMILDLVVAPSGETVCARVVKDLPLGLKEAAAEVAMRWRFPELTEGDHLRRLLVRLSCGFVTVNPLAGAIGSPRGEDARL